MGQLEARAAASSSTTISCTCSATAAVRSAMVDVIAKRESDLGRGHEVAEDRFQRLFDRLHVAILPTPVPPRALHEKVMPLAGAALPLSRS